MSKSTSRIVAARAAAEWLVKNGQPKLAEDVRALCRSHSCLVATASSIHRELEDTRRAAGMPTWERKSVDPGFEHIDPAAADGRLLLDGVQRVEYISREEAKRRFGKP